MRVNIKKLHPDAVIPRYAKPSDAGMDLYAVTKSIDE
jgi:dUTPase